MAKEIMSLQPKDAFFWTRMTVCLVFQTVWSGVKTINYTG